MTGPMTDISFFLSVILAVRRGDDEGGWIQLLIFIVMLVFFVISSIAKSSSEKRQQEKAKAAEESLSQLRRRVMTHPKPPASGKKNFSHKMPTKPVIPETVKIQPVEKVPTSEEEAPKKEKEAESLSAELIALEKYDELAKGIIYSEILGKPLALREPWQYE